MYVELKKTMEVRIKVQSRGVIVGSSELSKYKKQNVEVKVHVEVYVKDKKSIIISRRTSKRVRLSGSRRTRGSTTYE